MKRSFVRNMVVFLLLSTSTGFSQTNDSLLIKNIFDEALSSRIAYDNLRYLCKNMKGRVTGSSQAAAAVDMGGIEVAKKRHAVTIGLSTITYNPECTTVILAAGAAKAPMVRDAICNPSHILYPATALQKQKNTRFYLTQGASLLLRERQQIYLSKLETLSEEWTEKIIIDLFSSCRPIIPVFHFSTIPIGAKPLCSHSFYPFPPPETEGLEEEEDDHDRKGGDFLHPTRKESIEVAAG